MTIGYDYIILVRTVSRSICVVFVRSALEVSVAGTRAPSLAHERLLRRARRTLQELGFFVQAQLLKPDSDSTRQVKQVQRAANIVLDQQRCAPLLSSPLLFFFSPLVLSLSLSLWALAAPRATASGRRRSPSPPASVCEQSQRERQRRRRRKLETKGARGSHASLLRLAFSFSFSISCQKET